MLQNITNLWHMLIVIFAIVGSFYYCYGLAFIFAAVGVGKMKAEKAYRGWLTVSLIFLGAGLGMHLAVKYVKTGFYIPG